MYVMDTCSLFSMIACSVSLRPGQWWAEVRGSVQMLSRGQMRPSSDNLNCILIARPSASCCNNHPAHFSAISLF